MEKNFNDEFVQLKKILDNYPKIKEFVFMSLLDSSNDDSKVNARYEHSCRVARVAQYIGVHSELNFSDSMTLVVAGIMHDICKLEKENDHAIYGAMRSFNFLKENIDEEFAMKIYKIISTHSDKKNVKNFKKLNRILIEADIIEHGFIINYLSDKSGIPARLDKMKKQKPYITTKTGKKLYKKIYNNLKKYKKGGN